MKQHLSSRSAEATPAPRDSRLWMLAGMALLEIATIKMSFGELKVPAGLEVQESLIVQLADGPAVD